MVAYSPERAPVVFLIFNRPPHTRLSFAAIAAARPARLYIVGDGPRSTHPDDVALVRETRAIAESVDWPCKVTTNYSEMNLGCKRRVASGLDWVFDIEERAIIIEDDCVVDSSFFPYCDELLDVYRDNDAIHMVSGCNVLHPRRLSAFSYYCSRCYHIWGWATWRRAWRDYDIDMLQWPRLRESHWLQDLLGDRKQARVAHEIFELAYSGHISTWDFQWVLAGWIHERVSTIPTTNLVRNIGYGEQATNEHDANSPVGALSTVPLSFPLRHPPEVGVLTEADIAEWPLAYPEWFQTGSGLRRGLRSLSRTLGFARPTRDITLK